MVRDWHWDTEKAALMPRKEKSNVVAAEMYSGIGCAGCGHYILYSTSIKGRRWTVGLHAALMHEGHHMEVLHDLVVKDLFRDMAAKTIPWTGPKPLPYSGA